MTSPADDIDVNRVRRLKILFVITAVDYYVSGRFALLAGLVHVVGNLCHHAVEMLLKAHLVEKHALQELRKRPFGHNLPHLWQTFKAEVAADLDHHDETINELHKFEELRYPNTTLKQGAISSFGRVRSLVQVPDGKGRLRPVAQYSFGLNEIDDLVAAIFKAASINDPVPGAFLSDARRYLYKDNTAMREVDPSDQDDQR